MSRAWRLAFASLTRAHGANLTRGHGRKGKGRILGRNEHEKRLGRNEKRLGRNEKRLGRNEKILGRNEHEKIRGIGKGMSDRTKESARHFITMAALRARTGSPKIGFLRAASAVQTQFRGPFKQLSESLRA